MNANFPHQYRMSLTVAEHSARHIRRIIRTLLKEWGVEEVTEAVELAATELVTNVVRHVPDRSCTIRIARHGSGARVEVTDRSPRLPVTLPRAPSPESENGRGLLVVEGLVDKWGVDRVPGVGKTVWFECLKAPERAASAGEPPRE
ncbi:ATP-binding protein [Streptomyces sp. NPDC093252]|uniref:ATP-binding protein n=1 Tax=Streptomyces sp. NPDC093252 TaxID=3154980 RepID=UPI003426BBC2